MSNNILVIDPSVAGISGDMLLSASIDLGANEESTIQTILSIKNYFTGCKNQELLWKNIAKSRLTKVCLCKLFSFSQSSDQ